MSEPTPVKHFRFDARAVIALGRESIRDDATAIIELVKNGYDADALNVSVDLRLGSDGSDPTLIISDDGHGMTSSDVDDHWLYIGFSEKRGNPVSSGRRRKTGEKGIGRLSADRLGSHLEMRTHSEEGGATGAVVNWAAFEVPGVAVSQVPVSLPANLEFEAPMGFQYAPDASGTQLKISKLRGSWHKDDVEALRDELGLLITPFNDEISFRLYLYADQYPELSGEIDSPFTEVAAVQVDCAWDGEGNVAANVRTRTPSGWEESSLEIPWAQFVQRVRQGQGQAEQVIPNFGPASLSLLFYSQDKTSLSSTGFSVRELKSFLKTNVGVRIYRDGVRVRPYGDPRSKTHLDWLGLGSRKAKNPAGRGRSSFRVSPNQIVGAVQLTRDQNPTLRDASSREGLVANDEFEQLSDFVLGAVVLLEAEWHRTSPKEATHKSKTKEKGAAAKRLSKDVAERATALAASDDGPSNAVQNQKLAELVDAARQADAAVDELAQEVTILRGLATVGIAAVVFAHETESAISEMGLAVTAAEMCLGDEPVDLDGLREEIETLSRVADRIGLWGAFSLASVARDKRTKRLLTLQSLVANLTQVLEPVFRSADINLVVNVEDCRVRVFAMDVESILLNLLTNAYTACLQASGSRRIHVKLDSRKAADGREGIGLVVSDTGPGVALAYVEQVWEPLFTTRVRENRSRPGTGMGLAIVRSIVDDSNGNVVLTANGPDGGAMFDVWLPARWT